MRHLMQINPQLQRKRWVAHLDLLGASILVQTEPWESVFSAYAAALEAFKEESFDEDRLERLIFSDSFLVYSSDDSVLDYRAIDTLCRHFVVRLLERGRPVRGAIACSDLYADRDASLYFGNGLLESHEVGESTDWIGMVLAPSARSRLAELEFPVEERLNYAIWPVPVRRSKGSGTATRELAAFILSTSPNKQSVQRMIDCLRKLSASVAEDSIRQKYENSIAFLESNVRDAFHVISHRSG